MTLLYRKLEFKAGSLYASRKATERFPIFSFGLQENKGFSIVEVLIVMAIMGILFAVTVSQYSKYRDSKALSLGKHQVVNDIRMVQNYTYNTMSFDGGFPEGGYGIRFTAGSGEYIIFADKNGNKTYDAGSEKFKEMKLPENIKISSLKKNGVAASPVDLVFTPPYGVVYINGDNKVSGNFINLEITIKSSVSSNSEAVTVRSSGRIE